MEKNELNIMVVDDVNSARRVLVRLLKKIGYTNILEADSGSQAIITLSENTVGLVISDLHLNDMTGLELFSVIRGGKNQQIPFLMITSDMNRGEFEKAKNSGVDEYLLKPFTSDSLSEKIHMMLDKEK